MIDDSTRPAGFAVDSQIKANVHQVANHARHAVAMPTNLCSAENAEPALVWQDAIEVWLQRKDGLIDNAPLEVACWLKDYANAAFKNEL